MSSGNGTRFSDIFSVIALMIVAAGSVSGQEVYDPLNSSENLRVFIDCGSEYCDFDHLRRKINFVNHVRDRHDAQVHVLVTTLKTGSGGEKFTITFIGNGEFMGINDSLAYFSSDTGTFDEIREGITGKIKLGLLRYVMKTPQAERLQVSFLPTRNRGDEHRGIRDPWDHWIFRVRAGGDLSGEKRQESRTGEISISANRTTYRWKLRFFATGWYNEDEFELEDGSILKSIARDHSSGVFFARSLGNHWAIGTSLNASTSTFQNYDLALEAGPAIEYNIFPYSESTYRELVFTYIVLREHYDYTEMTIFDRTSEKRWTNSLEISYSVRQPFGTINTSLEASVFLDDFEQHSLELSSWMDIRLVRGFQLNLSGSIERIRDQVFLPRGGATDEEVLLRRQELGTDYRYSASLSLSYTFGSIYNNVVNPRFK